MAQRSVIQGFFPGGIRIPTPPPAAQTRTVQQRAAQSRTVQPRGAQPQGPVVQRSGNGEAFQLPANLSNFGSTSGQSLPKPVRQKMESFFNTSFADVRVHVGPQAFSIGAVAFTHGSNLYFAPGQYNPNTAQGQQLLGHELTHVVQQRVGRVRNPFGSGIAVIQDRSLEAEADRLGLAVASERQVLERITAVSSANSVTRSVPVAHQRSGVDSRTLQPYKVLPPKRIYHDAPNKTFPGYPYAVVGRAVFSAQTKGDNDFLAPNEENLANLIEYPLNEGNLRLRVSDDFCMAIEDSNLSNRQPKLFYATAQVFLASQRILQEQASGITLVQQPSNVITLYTSRSNSKQLVAVTLDTTLANPPQNCNAMAAKVLGGNVNAQGLTRHQTSAIDFAKDFAPKAKLEYKQLELRWRKLSKEGKEMTREFQEVVELMERIETQGFVKEYAIKRTQRQGQKKGLNKYASPSIGHAYMTVALGGDMNEEGLLDYRTNKRIKMDWSFHFAAVVAMSGGDRITLENYARDDKRQDRPDPRWYFQMYGGKSQSFHTAQKKTGFANPMTMVVRN